MIFFMAFSGETGARDNRVTTGFAYNCGNMIYWGGLIFVIAWIVINKKLLKDRLWMKEQQIRELDERNQHLHMMSDGWVMDAVLLIAYVAAMIASCYDMSVFYAAFGLLACAAVLKAGAHLAYSRGWL